MWLEGGWCTPSWPDSTHGNTNIEGCTSAPQCTWWNFFDIGVLNSIKQVWCGLFFYFFCIKYDKNRTAARNPYTKSHDKPWWRLLLMQSGVSACLQSLWKVQKASTLVWPIFNQRNTSLSERILLLTVGYFLYIHFIKPGILFTLLQEARVAYTGTKLPVTCMTCSSAPSACWRSPVRFSSRSSLCEEFGKWWGYTAEWQVLERRLPRWSDQMNWSLALQDRDSQTLSQNWGSKHLKCFHPCLSSCRLYAVFTSSV